MAPWSGDLGRRVSDVTLLTVDQSNRRCDLLIGVLCRRGHTHDGMRLSLRYQSGACVRCQAENASKRRATKGPEMDAKHAEWAAENPDKVRAYQAKHYKNNRAILLEKRRTYQRSHRKELAAWLRAYRRRRPEIMRACEARRVRSKEAKRAFNEYRKAWAAANYHRIREYAHRRSRLKLAGLPRGTIQKIGTLQGWKCASCRHSIRGRDYHKDHIVPLSKGGEHAARNIQLLCPSCNLRKGAKHPVDFMQSLGFLL